MITRIDIRDALSMLIANAADKTPDVGEATELAWAKYFDCYPAWTGDDLAAAVWEYCKTPRERLVQPADLGAAIRRLRGDAYDRMDPDERGDAWADLGGRPSGRGEVRLDRHGYVDKSEDDPAYPADWSGDRRLAAYWRRVRSGTSQRLDPEPVFAGDEHPPGAPCAGRHCDAPSTFGDYCAKHHVLYAACSHGDRGWASLGDLYRAADEGTR